MTPTPIERPAAESPAPVVRARKPVVSRSATARGTVCFPVRSVPTAPESAAASLIPRVRRQGRPAPGQSIQTKPFAHNVSELWREGVDLISVTVLQTLSHGNSLSS